MEMLCLIVKVAYCEQRFFRIFYFYVELFLSCSTVDCLHLHFTILPCVFGNGKRNGNPMAIAISRKLVDSMRMGGMGMQKSVPSQLYTYFAFFNAK